MFLRIILNIIIRQHLWIFLQTFIIVRCMPYCGGLRMMLFLSIFLEALSVKNTYRHNAWHIICGVHSSNIYIMCTMGWNCQKIIITIIIGFVSAHLQHEPKLQMYIIHGQRQSIWPQTFNVANYTEDINCVILWEVDFHCMSSSVQKLMSHYVTIV